MSNVVGKRTIVVALGAILALVTAMSLVLGFSLSRVASAADDCILSVGSEAATPAEVVSFFEIDFSGDPLEGDANLKVDNAAADCIDWLNAGTNTFRADVQAKNDSPSGGGDESFGQGTAENDAIPTVTYGSIPPQKSDLKAFGVHQEETTAGDEFLQLFWSRVQAPQGTTNMDFELNKRDCTANFQTPGTPSSDPDCVNNGVASNKAPAAIQGKTQFITPIRSGGDVLIAFDLASGGDTAIITLHKWVDEPAGTADHWDEGDCLAAPPGTADRDCPGGPSAAADAVGAVNATSTIPATESGGATNGLTTALGTLDPFTFGEASISFDALFGPNACGSFGSAYLKSRSSDSFTAEIKDFVPPKAVQIGNCPTSLTTDASNNGTASEPAQTLGGSISDSATLGSSVPNGADGKIEFRLYGPYTAQDKPTGPNAVCAANKLITAYGNTTPTPDGVGRTNVVNHNVTGAGNTANPYASPSFTPTAVGFYQWTAKFVPDAGQGLDPSAEFGCGQAVEQSQVIALPTATNTAQSFIPNDSATISQTAGTATALNGSVEFKLYNNSTNCNTNGATGLLYNETVTVSGNPPQTVSTNNDGVPADESSTDTDTDPGYTVRASTTDNLFWRVTYTPAANSSHSGSSSVCVEDSSVTISNT